MVHAMDDGDDRPWCAVGRRVCAGGDFGTVRWRGKIPGRRGSWCGVEWDSEERGKHDGSLDGVEYFRCAKEGPRRASFVRAAKLEEPLSCADAVRLCYRADEDESAAAVHRAIIDDWKRKIRVPFVEMVGFDSVRQKQSDPAKLREASVSERRVWTAGDLLSVCPSLETLDVSKNLLSDWSAVADVASRLPRLLRLDLSKNVLAFPTTPEEIEDIARRVRGLRQVSLAFCDMEWKDALVLAKILPNVQELVLAHNRIADIAIPPTGAFFQNLTKLVLDGNPVAGWDRISKLGPSSPLKELSANECRLSDIFFEDDHENRPFPDLETLYVKHNRIADWRSISELNKLKSLRKLYINNNPLVSTDDYDTISQLVIARIENLKELNGSVISGEMRRGAEYDYLKKYGYTWKSCKESNNATDISQFALYHSRFDQLIEKYGLPDDNLLRVKKDTWAISSRLIEIFIREDSTGSTIKKKVPATMTIQKLLALSRRIFSQKCGAPGTSMSPTLYYVQKNASENLGEILIPMDNEMKELNFYSICDSDVIVFRC